MSKSPRFLSVAGPGATVFVSSFCVMALELAAGRLLARSLGSSLYTWTAVIGVVLAGITIGNYLGGHIADRFAAGKATAMVFALASAGCVGVAILDNLLPGWILLWRLSWPVRVLSHVTLLFLAPSILLGAIAPLAAKTALDRGLPAGRTIGDIYACGAAGSIAGTFAAGYWLIGAMGTIAFVWVVAAVLLATAIIYHQRLWPVYVWGVVFVVGAILALAPAGWARNAGASLALRSRANPNILYEDDTQYCYVSVRRVADYIDHRTFLQDKLKHSEIIMNDPCDLRYFYLRTYAAVTRRLAGGREKPATMMIGGGGYVFPRYVATVWPGSRVDVAEIDPGITEAATRAFGLKLDGRINVIHLDARNYVDALIAQNRNSPNPLRYDFIYGDAFNDYSVPFQLVTREFNEKVAELLADDGVFAVNLIDVFDSALFLGAYVNTLELTLPNVYVFSEHKSPRSARATFVVVAAKRPLDLTNLAQDYPLARMDLRQFSESDISQFRERAGNRILTDDYVPVENLMAPVVRRSALESLVAAYFVEASQQAAKGRMVKAVEAYEQAASADPSQASAAHSYIGQILARAGRSLEATDWLNKALAVERNKPASMARGMIHYELGVIFRGLGRDNQAGEHFLKAVADYRAYAAAEPGDIKAQVSLGDALLQMGRYGEAARIFESVLGLCPLDADIRIRLAASLHLQGRTDAAIEIVRRGIDLMRVNNEPEKTAQLTRYLQGLLNRRPQVQK